MLFETRAARLHGLNIEFRDLNDPVRQNTCRTCGHLVCDHLI